MLATLSQYLLTIIAFLFVFGLLIFVHEFGHFIMAKRAGILVKEFGFGIPPRLFGIRKGETLYSLNLIPLGGFVKMLGQDDFDPQAVNEGKLNPRHFENKSIIQRILVVCGGVTMNMLLAILLFTVGYSFGMKPAVEESSSFKSALQTNGALVYEIVPNSPASSSPLKENDIIIGADNTALVTSEDVQKYTQEHSDDTVNYTILRDNKVLTIPITPDPIEKKIGIKLSTVAEVKTIKYPIHLALYHGLEDTYLISKLTLQSFGQLIYKLITSFQLSKNITGPVGIMQITHNVVQFGFISLLQFAGILSVSLGIINIVPFPALDGGRLLFILLETVSRGKKLSPLVEGNIHIIGFFLLIALIIAVTYQDLLRIFSN